MKTNTKAAPLHFALIATCLLAEGALAQNVGNWDLSSWSYNSNSPITTSTVNSDGNPVGLTVTADYSVSGSGSSALGHNVIYDSDGTGLFRSSHQFSWSFEPSVESLVDFTSSRKLSFSQPVDFGSAADQSVGIGFPDPNNNGFGLFIDTEIYGLEQASFTLLLEGGAVFGASTPYSFPSAFGEYNITGGGAGSNFMELTWNPSSGNGGKIYFNDINILGPVTGIESIYSGLINRGTDTAGTDSFFIDYQIQGTKATVVPEPSALLLLLGGTCLFFRRRR